MEETKKKVSELCELKDKLICAAREATSKGIQNIDTHEMGEVTDMIKDLAEAEEKCWKACYYKKIVEAMHEEKEEEEMLLKLVKSGEMDPSEMIERRRGSGRMGYDHWRTSSGRFAPKGTGHYSAGYRPMEDMHDMEPWMMAEGFENPWGQMMGYSDGQSRQGDGRSSDGSQNGSSRGSRSSSTSYDGRMGYTGSERGHRYDRYNQARMGYHQSKSASDKEHMDASAREYVVDIAESVKEMWNEADPAMRKEIKNKFVALTGEMN